MKLVSLTISGYRQFLEPTTLKIPSGLIGICGPNGVGKSKLIEAIGYALYGPVSSILPKTDRVADLAAKAGKAIPRVALSIEIRGQQYEVVRSTQGRTLIQLGGAEDVLADGASSVTQKVVELLRLNADAFCGTFLARQNEVVGLQSLDPSRRRRVVNRLIGITQVEQAIQLAKETKADRGRSLDIVKLQLRMPSTEAQQQLDSQRADLKTSVAAHDALERYVAALTQQLEAVTRQRDALKRREDQVAHYQQMLAQLSTTELTATRRFHLSKERLEKAQVAVKKLAEAEEIIHQTAEVENTLAHFDLLAEQHDALQQQQVITEQLGQRAKLGTKIEDTHTAINRHYQDS